MYLGLSLDLCRICCIRIRICVYILWSTRHPLSLLYYRNLHLDIFGMCILTCVCTLWSTLHQLRLFCARAIANTSTMREPFHRNASSSLLRHFRVGLVLEVYSLHGGRRVLAHHKKRRPSRSSHLMHAPTNPNLQTAHGSAVNQNHGSTRGACATISNYILRVYEKKMGNASP